MVSPPVREWDVRAALRESLRRHESDDSLILDEFALLGGDTRVDVAVINGELSGYEIKSAADTLKRLPRQQALYSRVLDRAWLVSTPERVERLEQELPAWWGLIAATARDSQIVLATIREAGVNHNRDPDAIAQLLWRDEVLGLLAARGEEKGLRSKPREVLWARLTAVCELDELREAVRTALKTRANWRVDRPQERGGVRSPVGARFLASLV